MTQIIQDSWHPRVLVGAPAGRLNASPVERACPIAIEIADGIGFGIDGEALIVDDSGRDGRFSITGNLEDGSHPERDFVLMRDGGDTYLQGVEPDLSYHLHRDGNVLDINGLSDAQTSAVIGTPDGLVVFGKLPQQRYFLGLGAQNVVTVEGYDKTVNTKIVYTPDHVSIQNEKPERCFEISKTEEGFHVDGAYDFQDFDVKITSEGFVVQGHYPQIRYEVTKVG